MRQHEVNDKEELLKSLVTFDHLCLNKYLQILTNKLLLVKLFKRERRKC